MNFAQKLKDLRIERNLTQEELAKKSGISLKTISRYELNETLPRTEKYYKRLADALDVNDDYFLFQKSTFVIGIQNTFDSKRIKDIKDIVNDMISLMSTNELSYEDKTNILNSIQEVFYMAKFKDKKYMFNKHNIEEE